MKKSNLHPSVLSLFFLLFNCPIWSQKIVKGHPDAVNIAQSQLAILQKNGELTAEDVQNAVVEDYFIDDFNGVTYVYMIQKQANFKLFNGICNVSVLPSGEVLSIGNRFVKNLSGIVNTTSPSLSAEKAVLLALSHLEIPLKSPLSIKSKKEPFDVYFDKGTSVLTDIHAQLVYQKINNTSARLAWDLTIDALDGAHLWNLRIDALDGKVLEKTNLTVSCTFYKDAYSRELCDEPLINEAQIIDNQNFKLLKAEKNISTEMDALMLPPNLTSSYRAFPLPADNPTQVAHTLIVNPADTLGSPFGWHDTNGAVGAEYTITRGNNVHAYEDFQNNNVSINDEPNGGSALKFDFPYNATVEPDSNRNAAVVNLFYINNIMHDLSFRHGFTEVAGNFQALNYTGVSGSGDYVKAEAMDGKDVRATAKCPTTAPCVNNANFSTPPDGGSPRMQMYVWDLSTGGSKNVVVVSPQSIAGTLETATADAGFGAAITATPVTGDAVFVSDGSSLPTQGCGTITTNLTGKIALIDRGTCEFGLKALNAQRKGAIGVIICNVDETLNIIMQAGASGSQVTIPVSMIKRSDCERIKAALNTGAVRISIVNPAAVAGPTLVDGDFDNGIMAHEYTHGISSRLTGGRLNASCLSSGELQAGEGWSDFLSLAFTTKLTDRGTIRRNIGTFAERNAGGVRRYPYTTDLTANPLTYDDMILDPEVHSTGEVWCAALWDVYWSMTDLYGFDANFRNVGSGNGKVVRMVIDAMKIQPCNPGFLEARDAILAADRADFAGANQCLIWDAFARRGMGYNAVQGLNSSKTDNTEGFEKYPFCMQKLKITKKTTPLIKAGDQISITLQVINHKGIAATSVVVTDELPTGLTYVAGSASRAVTQNGAILSFNIGSMNDRDTVTITYKAASDPTKKSIASFSDDFERGDNNWELDNLGSINADNIWNITTDIANSGVKSFYVRYPTTDRRSDQVTYTKVPQIISGRQPVLRFWHVYDTEPGFDAGIVQISTNNGTSWFDLGDKFFKNPYRGKVPYSTFSIPNAKGWWGKSNANPTTWIDSYADLSTYIGQSVQFRFRFSTDSLIRAQGWFIDDVAVMDMVNYNGVARLTSAQGDTASAQATARGTIVDASLFTPTKENTEGVFKMRIFPNPASNLLNINILDSERTHADLTIVAADGRLIWSKTMELVGNHEEVLPVDISAFPSGIYFVKISTDKKVLVEKVVKH